MPWFEATAPFLLWKGFLAGLVFAVTTLPAAVWCVQLAVWRGRRAAAVAVAAVAAGQLCWAAFAAAPVWMLARARAAVGPWPELTVRAFCALIFVYMAWKALHAQPVRELPAPDRRAPEASWPLAVATLAVTLSMPMRLFGYLGLYLSMNLARARLEAWSALPLAVGAGVAALVWYGAAAAGGAAWARRGERTPDWWGRLIARQSRLAACVYAALAMLVALPVLARLGR